MERLTGTMGVDKSGKGYIALKPTPESAKQIHKFVSNIGIKDSIPADDLHMTIMYDESNPGVDYITPGALYSATVDSIEELGEGEWKALVLKMNCPEVVKRHKELRDLGFRHSYDDFTPHISVKYKATPEEVKLLQSNFDRIRSELPEIALGEEYSEKISTTVKESMATKLANDIANMVTEKLASLGEGHMTKIGLNARKARALAESVGLIPHHMSDWKWALRNMRKANPTGAKNVPLMMEGKELSDAKRGMGMLSNNEMQKIKSFARKGGYNKEIGMYDTAPIRIGSTTGVSPINDIFGYNTTFVAHTHPDQGALARNSLKRYGMDEYTRTGDKVLLSSPSGWYGQFNVDTAREYRKKVKTLVDQYDRALKQDKLVSREPDLVDKLHKYVGHANTGSEIAPEVMAELAPLANRLEAVGMPLKHFSSTRQVESLARRVAGNRKFYNNKIKDLMANKFGAPENLGGDMSALAQFKHRGDTGVIIGPEVTGAHSPRFDRERGLRSIYFKGGFS